MTFKRLSNYFQWNPTESGEKLQEKDQQIVELEKELKEKSENQDESKGESKNQDVPRTVSENQVEPVEKSDDQNIPQQESDDPVVPREVKEHLERGIIFSSPPVLDPKYKKQIVVGGTGGLMNYMLGVVLVIKENFDLDDCILSGTSGGCTSCLFLLMPEEKLKIHDFLDHNNDFFFCKDFIDTLFGGRFWSQGNVNDSCYCFLNKILEEYYPDEETREKEILERCHGRLYISTTKLKWFQNYIINHWDSLEEFTHSFLSSMTIPFWSQWTISKTYKQNWLMDGGFSNSTPDIFEKLPILYLECHKWRDFRWNDYYPHHSYQEHTKLRELGVQDTLEHLEELEEFFGQTAKCRQYINLVPERDKVEQVEIEQDKAENEID